MKRARFLMRGCALVVFFGLIVMPGLGQKRIDLPKGNWTFQAVPYSGSDWSSMPLSVHAVTTNMASGGTIERVILANWSRQTVEGVRLKWMLYKDKNLLLEGETKLLGTNVGARKTQTLDYPVVNFSRVIKSSSKSSLSGSYKIEIVVSELEYVDGPNWKLGEPGIVWEGFDQAVENGCANQGCAWLAEQNTYICVGPSEGTYCSVGSQGQSCTITRCSRTPPLEP